MSNLTIADLLGVRSKSIQWERPFLFFGALFLAGIIHLVFVAWQTSSVDSGFSIEWVNILPPSEWSKALLFDFLLAGVAFAAFRWIPNNVGAIAAVAIGYPLIRRALYYLFLMPEAGSGTSAWLWNPIFFLQSVVWTASFFGCIAVALRRIEKLWLALLVGTIASEVLSHLFSFLRAIIAGNEIQGWEMQLLYFARSILNMAVFAALFWAGLRFASGKSLEVKDEATRLSRGFYTGTLSVTYGVPFVIVMATLLFQILGEWNSRSELEDALMLMGVAFLPLTYGVVVFCRLIYKMWAAIQDGHARTTPGKALGFCFIPFFNFYWGFQAFTGFAKDYNALVQRNSLNVSALSTGVFTAYMVLCLVALIPVVGYIVTPVLYVILLVMVSKICNAVNALP